MMRLTPFLMVPSAKVSSARSADCSCPGDEFEDLLLFVGQRLGGGDVPEGVAGEPAGRSAGASLAGRWSPSITLRAICEVRRDSPRLRSADRLEQLRFRSILEQAGVPLPDCLERRLIVIRVVSTRTCAGAARS
jgi:hypothetical protein